jgi:A/G-specific adenine glycosylase
MFPSTSRLPGMIVLPVPDSQGHFQDSLLTWFAQARRDFPWRSQRDPYAVLIAEKLLQQTAARDVVVRSYEHLLRRYPTPKLLAQARVPDIEDIIRPLGFAYRAVELREMAQSLVARHGGEVPADLGALLALPGVGDYAARAVLSFAFGKDVPVVDTNVARFLYRLYGLLGPQPTNPARKKSLINLAATLVPTGRSKDYNLAVLDLCAAVCKPGVPLCALCPVRTYCMYSSEGTPDRTSV